MGLGEQGQLVDAQRLDQMRRQRVLENRLDTAALGLVELRSGEREAGLAHIERAAGELRDSTIVELVAGERG